MTYNSIEEFTAALERAKIALPTILFPIAKTLNDVLAKNIKDRVGTTGKASGGDSFSPYSSEKYKARKVKTGVGTLGKTTAFKNFYLSGSMWGSFGTRNIKLNGDRITANIDFAGNNPYSNKTNEELNQIHSEIEKQGIAYPTTDEELLLVAALEKAVFESLTTIL